MWIKSMAEVEKWYMAFMDCGAKPQEARAVLPNSLKTEIWCTFNVREWRHFFSLRNASAAHPQMKDIAGRIQLAFGEKLPLMFGPNAIRYQ